MVDRLHRLRHDAVVRSDDEHGDVRHLRAAGTECRERLVARGVEEGDAPAGVVDLVRADVLRDPAGLGLDDRGLAERVEERRLAVVDVAHDRHDGRTLGQIGRIVLVDLGLEIVLVVGVLDAQLAIGRNSAAISSIASSESDCVMLTISPAAIRNFMIFWRLSPSAEETSLTVAPDRS